MDVLEKLKSEYRSSLPQKLDTIRITVAAVTRSLESKAKPDWENLEFIVHKFAGSSGTYGFKAMSNHARELEDRIYNKLFATESATNSKVWLETWLQRLDDLVEGEIKSAKKKAA